MHSLIPLWIIGGPAIAVVILSFSFGKSSSMGGTAVRLPPRDASAPLLDPVHPGVTRPAM